MKMMQTFVCLCFSFCELRVCTVVVFALRCFKCIYALWYCLCFNKFLGLLD